MQNVRHHRDRIPPTVAEKVGRSLKPLRCDVSHCRIWSPMMKTNRIFITATSPHAAFCASRRTSSSGRGLCKNPVICVKPKMPPNPLTVILDLGLTGSIRPSHARYFAHAAYGLLSLNSNPIVDRATGAQVTIHAARSRPDRDLSRDANIVAFIGPIIPGRLDRKSVV